jgi:ADP-L-glycero-D-manno-heptose 6-epimerase
MKILITGTKGFIGSNLFNELKDKNEILEINEDIFNSDDWEVELYNQLNSFNPEVVFHVGACSDTLEQDVNYMMLVNYEFTKKLSDWCYHMGPKMIYSSSAANYGTNNRNPSNLYGWSKYVAEQHVIKNGGIGLRYFNVYGPLEENKGRMASVAYQMFKKQKEGQEIKLFPNKPKRDFVYIKDVVSANLYALEHFDKLNSKWYEVGSGEARTFEDVLEILNIKYTFHDENKIPVGYQFYTKSDENKWMNGWRPIFKIDNGLLEYKKYLDK